MIATKKCIIASMMLFFVFSLAKGQDKIITVRKDTIVCRILSISSTYINYEQKAENQSVVGKFIPIEQVLEYQKTSWAWDEKPARPWLIGIQAGGSFLTASSAKDVKNMTDVGISKSQADDYYRQLKYGFHLGGDVHYLLNNWIGVGAKYSFFTSSANSDFIIKLDDYFPTYFSSLSVKEKLYINYVGPSVIFRQYLDKNRKFQLSETLSAGYVHVRDEVRIGFPSFSSFSSALLEGSTWGGAAGVSLEYFPLPRLSVGANAGFMYARLTKADITTQDSSETIEFDKKDYQDYSKPDYSLAVRFHF